MQTPRTDIATASVPKIDRDTQFEQYVHAKGSKHLAFSYLICGNKHEAEDILQTSYAKLYLAWGRLENSDALDAYMRKIILNEAKSLWRRAWRRKENSTDELPQTGQSPVYDEGQQGEMWQLLQQLSHKHKTVLVLRFYEDLSVKETAEALKISEGTVKSQTNRALAALKAITPDHFNPVFEEGKP